MPQGVVIIGVQWGDEGKGKIVDYYAESADVVARFQGGNNAGHTIVVGRKPTVLHLIPSGILHHHTECLIGSGVVLDPEVFLAEVELLKAAGIPHLEKRLAISDRCHLILDYHKHLDAAREGKKSDRLGTTKRGIGPAYEDRAARRGLRVADLYNAKEFSERLRSNFEEKNFLLKEYYKVDEIPFDQCIEKYTRIAERLRPYVCDVSTRLHKHIENGKKILYEGAQGILLDIDYGTYPFVTSSHTLPSQSALGLGARLPEETLFIGTLKAYSTRVGEGPFPTELQDTVGDRLRQTGQEFGATTGRPRRCGWLDLVAVKYALQVSGIKHLSITKADVLSGFDTLQLCTGYSHEGKVLESLPADSSLLWKVRPVYQALPGWKEELKCIKTAKALPANFLSYVRFIEDYTGAKVNLISTGAGREDVIDIQSPFYPF